MRHGLSLLRLFFGLCTLSCLVACQSDSPSAPSAAASPQPTRTTTSAPPPSTTTTTTATQPPPQNRPPTVSISGGSTCHPRVNEPCEVGLNASAHDPDGDPLSFSWSGCASGQESHARCLVERPAAFVASVTVTDGRGGSAQAEATAVGVNSPPQIPDLSCGYYPPCLPPDPPAETLCPAPVPTNAASYCGYGFFDGFDAERDRVRCEPAVAVVGPCFPGHFFECGGVEDSATFDFHAGSTPGECVFTVVFEDDWGARSTRAIRVSVRAR